MQNPNTHDVRRPALSWAARGVVTALLALFLPLAAAELPPESSDGWELRKETDAIQVFTTDQPNSSFQAFKAVTVIDAPIENVMAVMINPKSCLEWVHNCSESYAFGEGDFHDRYAYSVNNMPWPVADRDYVLRIRTHGAQDEKDITMDLNAVPERLDANDGLVRVDRSDTLYRFTPMGDQTRMVWVQHTEPNGALPGWLVNSLLVDIPIKSMEELERVANKDRYRNFELVYDTDGSLIAVVPAESEEQTGDDDA